MVWEALLVGVASHVLKELFSYYLDRYRKTQQKMNATEPSRKKEILGKEIHFIKRILVGLRRLGKDEEEVVHDSKGLSQIPHDKVHHRNVDEYVGSTLGDVGKITKDEKKWLKRVANWVKDLGKLEKEEEALQPA